MAPQAIRGTPGGAQRAGFSADAERDCFRSFGGYPMRMLKEAVDEERTKRGFGNFISEPLISSNLRGPDVFVKRSIVL